MLKYLQKSQACIHQQLSLFRTLTQPIEKRIKLGEVTVTYRPTSWFGIWTQDQSSGMRRRWRDAASGGGSNTAAEPCCLSDEDWAKRNRWSDNTTTKATDAMNRVARAPANDNGDEASICSLGWDFFVWVDEDDFLESNPISRQGYVLR